MLRLLIVIVVAVYAGIVVAGTVVTDIAVTDTVVTDSEVTNVIVMSPDHWDDTYDEQFRKYSEQYFGPHFDWRWFKAQAIVESSLDQRATSASGARGLMQILPSTYGDIRRKQTHLGKIDEPVWNIAAGIYYDRTLFRKWQGLPAQDRLNFSLASYNAGYVRVLRAYRKVKGTVRGWEQVKAHIPAETRTYVERIRQLMEQETQPLRVAQLAGYLPAAE